MTCPPPTPHTSQFMLLFCFHSSEKRVRKISLRVEKRILYLIVFLLKRKRKKGIPPSSSLSIILGRKRTTVPAWPDPLL